jgi:hypothetical protein
VAIKRERVRKNREKEKLDWGRGYQKRRIEPSLLAENKLSLFIKD